MNNGTQSVQPKGDDFYTLSDRLRSEAYIVDLASDGPEGLKKATNLTFDLIILDIMLPVEVDSTSAATYGRPS
jgi:CheY-like chemotaxis protein